MKNFFQKSYNLLKKDDHKLANSFLNLCYFCIERNFYDEKEIVLLKIYLMEFIKNGYVALSNSQQNIEKETELLLNSKTKNSIYSFLENEKHDSILLLEHSPEYEIVCNWMKTVIKCLILIEKIEQNNLHKIWLKKKNFLKFVIDENEKNLNIKRSIFNFEDEKKSEEFLSKLKEEKFSCIKEFFFSLQYPETNDIYYLLDLLLLNNKELNSKIIHLISLIFSAKKNFIKSMNNSHVINTNEEYKEFIELKKIKSQIRFNLINLKFFKSNQITSIQNEFQEMNKNLLQLLQIIFCFINKEKDFYTVEEKKFETEDVSNNLYGVIVKKEETNKENALIIGNNNNEMTKNNKDEEGGPLLIKEIPSFNINVNSKENEEGDNLLFGILNKYYFCINTAKRKQILLKELNFQDIIFDVLNYGLLYGIKEKILLERSLIMLIFFVFKFDINQELIHNEKKYNKILQQLLSIEEKKIQLCVILLIAEIYRNNKKLLFYIEKDQHHIIRKLGWKFNHYYKKEKYEFCCFFLEILQILFNLEDCHLDKNKIWILDQLTSNRIDLFSPLINSLEKCLKVDFYGQINDKGIIQIPPAMIFLTNLLKLFNEMALIEKEEEGEKSEGNINKNSKILNYLKQFFSLNKLKELLEKLEKWYPLKFELVKFLEKVYTENEKLEVNEIDCLQSILAETFVKNLKLYKTKCEMQANFKSSWKFSTGNFFFLEQNYCLKENFEGEYKFEDFYFEDFNELEEKYIIEGILKVMAIYLTNFHNFQRDKFQIVEIYINLMKDFLTIWDLPLTEKKKNFFKKGKTRFSVYGKNISRELVLTQQNSKKKERNYEMKTINEEKNSLVLENEKKVFIKVNKNKEEDYLNELINIIKSALNFSQLKTLKSKIIKEEEEFKIGRRSLFYKNKTLNNNFKRKKQKDFEMEKEGKNFEEKIFFTEIDFFVGYLAELKNNENQDLNKFTKILKSLINLISENNSSNEFTKLNTLVIFRRLAFLQEMSAKFQRNIIQLEAINILCKAFSIEQSPSNKIEYIITLVDLFNKGNNKEIQEDFYIFLKNEKNSFLIDLRDFILENFNEYKEAEKNSQRYFNNYNFKEFLQEKKTACISSLELLRLSCENHYSPMQNFLREQQQENLNSKNVEKNVNIIVFIAEILEKYSNFICENNVDLGEQLLDNLIELLQGPCIENQFLLCQKTKLLENFEDIIENFAKNLENKLNLSGFYNKIMILLLALFEGNNDQIVLNKIANHFSIDLMLDIINDIYLNYSKIYKKMILHSLSKKKRKKGKEKNLWNLTNVLFDSIAFNNKKNLPFLNFDVKNLENCINFSFNIYILIFSLKFLNSDFGNKVKKSINDNISFNIPEKTNIPVKNYEKMIKYYKSNVSFIEIINSNNEIQRHYFRKHPITKYFSTISQEKFMEKVSRDSANEKINGLLKEEPVFFEEMQHFLKLRTKGLRFNLTIISQMNAIGLYFALIINLIILFSVTDRFLVFVKLYLFLISKKIK